MPPLPAFSMILCRLGTFRLGRLDGGLEQGLDVGGDFLAKSTEGGVFALAHAELGLDQVPQVQEGTAVVLGLARPGLDLLVPELLLPELALEAGRLGLHLDVQAFFALGRFHLLQQHGPHAGGEQLAHVADLALVDALVEIHAAGLAARLLLLVVHVGRIAGIDRRALVEHLAEAVVRVGDGQGPALVGLADLLLGLGLDEPHHVGDVFGGRRKHLAQLLVLADLREERLALGDLFADLDGDLLTLLVVHVFEAGDVVGEDLGLAAVGEDQFLGHLLGCVLGGRGGRAGIGFDLVEQLEGVTRRLSATLSALASSPCSRLSSSS